MLGVFSIVGCEKSEHAQKTMVVRDVAGKLLCMDESLLKDATKFHGPGLFLIDRMPCICQ